MASGFSSLARQGHFSRHGRWLLCRADVFGGAHEAQGDIIGADVESEGKILAIFWRERRDFQFHAGKIDTLVLSETATIFDLRDNFGAASGNNAHRNLSVAQQNAVVFFNGIRKLCESSADAFGAGKLFGSDREFLPKAKVNAGGRSERAGTDFRSLQIGENRNGFLVIFERICVENSPGGHFLHWCHAKN